MRFDSLPAGWVVEQNVMDPVWTSLGVRGLNVYAYGGPVAPQPFAARSDPASPLYQAWFGAYLIPDSSAARPDVAMQLAAVDQRSWLAAMGDPQPMYELTHAEPHATIDIDGLGRALYTFDAKSHSDLGPGTTPLAQHVGMPPAASWPSGLAAFHELELRGYFTYWYDATRHVTVIVYACASAFRALGKSNDNFPALEADVFRMMRNVRVREAGIRTT